MRCCRSGRLGFVVVAIAVAGLGTIPATAQQTLQAVGGPIPLPYDAASQQIDAIHPDAVATARALGLSARLPGAIPFALDRDRLGTLNFPMRLRPAGRGASGAAISNFVDLDGTAALRDYACGQRTYDGHRGIDIFTWPFGLWKMDNNDAEIVAAAPGAIVQKVDGNQDRNCVPVTTTPPPLANLVAVRHDDGAFAYYLHMKSGSLTSKGVGERVVTGEKLGIVGSSGRSTGPHLHFEMRDDVNVTIDPFAGLCGASRTLWKHQ